MIDLFAQAVERRDKLRERDASAIGIEDRYAELRLQQAPARIARPDLYPSRLSTLAANAEVGSFAQGYAVPADTVLSALLLKAENPCGERDPKSAAPSDSSSGRFRTCREQDYSASG